MQERQFDGVADLLNLPGQSTDIAVVHIGHLLEHEVLHLGLGDALEGVTRLRIDQQRVAGSQLAGLLVIVEGVGHLGRHVLGRHQWLGQPNDPLFVGVADDQRTMAVGQYLAKRADLPDRLEGARLNHRECLVEPNRLALLHLTDGKIGRAGQPHLAARSEHIDGVVVLDFQQHAVATRGLTQPVDLLAQRQ